LIEWAGPEGTSHLAWDANQRLIESTVGPRTTTYRYDPLGRRVSKETDGDVTHFYWDGDALLSDGRVTEDDTRADALLFLREWVYYPETFEPLAMIQSLCGPKAHHP
jgi:YD repeat-containing protein